MQWSQMKKQVESFFAPSVAGRVELRSTSYRRSHDGEGRVWITLDGEERSAQRPHRSIRRRNHKVSQIPRGVRA
jgi:hypothetical protein